MTQMAQQAQLEMVNTVLSDAEAVCKGKAKLIKEYQPEPGDSWETTLAGRVHHQALLEAVLQYLKRVMLPDVLREMGHTRPVPDARLQSMAEQMRDHLLVDSLE
jgi:hypothetical protein